LNKVRWVFLGITAMALMASAIIVAIWGDWLREEVLRPLIVGWVWLIFYITHLPQWAVWFFALGILALIGLKALPIRMVNPISNFRRIQEDEVHLRGPVSGWHHEIELALNGSMYRRKLHRRFKRELGETTSDETQRALAQLDAPHRWRPSANNESINNYLKALNTVLDALERKGEYRATE
jgi:AraC-like DNA-binding protein